MQIIAGDQFWDDMDLALPFDERLFLPNSPNMIHEGQFRMRTDSDARGLNLFGKIEQAWHPVPKARFTGVPSRTDQNVFSLLSKHFSSCHEELEYSCTLTRVKELPGGLECSGSIDGLLIKGARMLIDELRFSLVNFPEFLGIKVKRLGDKTGHRCSLESITVSGNEWALRIDQRFQAGDLLAEVAAKGGYISTHSCSLKRTDGEPFEPSSAFNMINCLTFFFGFLAGRWCGPVLPVGFMNNSVKWEIFGSYQVTPTLKGDSWFPLDYALDISSLLSGFLALWDSDSWAGPLKQAIHWLVTANTNQNAVETGMVAAFVPIEMLCWLILVESEGLYSIKEFKQMEAAAKLRELLRVCNIPDYLPAHHASLREDMGDQDELAISTVLVEIRNAIAHPRKTKRDFLGKLSGLSRYKAKELCLQILELVLLKSMAYTGRYRMRAYGGWSGEEYQNVPWFS